MAIIRPFRAWRFSPAAVPDWNRRLVPLDLYSQLLPPSQQDVAPHAGLLVSASQAQAAGELANTWRDSGVLQQDPLPAIYPLYQRYNLYGASHTTVRKGFLALVHLPDDSREPGILPHEQVLAEALPPRIATTLATELQVAPAHGLYEDPTGEIDRLLDQHMQYAMDEAVDSQGVIMQMGMLQQPQALARVASLLHGKHIYLADGHHRLRTAQHIQQLRAAEPVGTGLHRPADWLLMYLSRLEDPGLAIQPTHRVVEMPAQMDQTTFLAGLAQWYNVMPFGSREPYHQQLARHHSAIGIVWQGLEVMAIPRPELQTVPPGPADLPVEVRRQHYTLLHYLVLDQLLGYQYYQQAQNPAIHYYKDAQLAVAASNASHAAFIMPGTSKADFAAACQSGSFLPPKSTYFYPKVQGGWAMASLRPQDYTRPADLLAYTS